MKTVGYLIEIGFPDQVMDAVNDLLREGWEPLGPCQFGDVGGLTTYIQTMVKRSSDSDP